MKCYDDIADLPIYNWFKCIDTKDYSYVLVERKKCNSDELLKCELVFGDLYSQFLDEFGVSDNLQAIIRLQNQILVHKIDFVLTGDATNEVFIDIKEIELKKLLEVKEVKGNSAKVAIEKMLGFAINERAVSVKSYYEYINELKKENG